MKNLILFILLLGMALPSTAQFYRTKASGKMHLMKLLHEEGNPASVNMNGNYSGDTTKFIYAAPTNEAVSIYRILVGIKDVNIINTGTYGAISELPNGIKVYVEDKNGNPIVDLTSFTIKNNGDWGMLCYDVAYANLGSGSDYVNVRWTLANTGEELVLNDGQRIAVWLRDDFTGLEVHQFEIQGFYYNRKY